MKSGTESGADMLQFVVCTLKVVEISISNENATGREEKQDSRFAMKSGADMLQFVVCNLKVVEISISNEMRLVAKKSKIRGSP